jgi:hypothetical protein
MPTHWPANLQTTVKSGSMAAFPLSSNARMPAPSRTTSASLAAALCASALSRLAWAAGALLLLWITVFWALS